MTLRAVAVVPEVVRSAFQDWLIFWPEDRVQVTVQVEIAVAPAVTVTSPW